MNNIKIPKAMSVVWLGIVLQIVSIVFDSYWHATHGPEAHIQPVHWLTVLGIIIAVVGVVIAWKRLESTHRAAVTIAVLGVSGQIVGIVWDEALHIIGEEPAPTALPHLLPLLGLLILIVGAVGTSTLQWRATSTPE
jgi:hypothetical protein